MPEPLLPAAATIATQAAVVPVLTLFGVKLGMQPDVLLAGFCGSVAAMGLLNTVPATGDTLRELARTSLRRAGVAIGSSFTAAYLAPLLLLVANVPDHLVLSLAFLIGGGAQQYLRRFLVKFQPPSPTPPSQGDNR